MLCYHFWDCGVVCESQNVKFTSVYIYWSVHTEILSLFPKLDPKLLKPIYNTFCSDEIPYKCVGLNDD